MSDMPFWAAAQLVTATGTPLDFRVSLEDMVSGTGRLVDGELSAYESDGIRFQPGDVLFGKLRPYLAKYWLADREGTAGGDIHVYRPAAHIDPRFLFYVVGTSDFTRYAEAASKGTKMPRAEWASLREFRMLQVGKATQRRISGFLDQETAEMDAMNVELDLLLVTLEERRRSVVDLVVLCDAPRVSLAWAAEGIHTGPFGTQVKASDYVTGGTPLINPSHIVAGAIRADDRVTVGPDKALELARHAMRSGDLVVGRRGEMGRCAVVTQQEAGWLCGTGSLRLVPKLGLLDPEFANIVVASRESRAQMLAYSVGATMDNLNEDLLGRVKIPLPPLPEQHRIVEHLGRQTAQIDAMIAEAQKLRALLAERRTTLITEVVTGRKEIA